MGKKQADGGLDNMSRHAPGTELKVSRDGWGEVKEDARIRGAG